MSQTVVTVDVGGTGATTAAAARNNLGAMANTGGSMTGNLTLSGATLNTATANISTIVTGNTLTLSTGTGSNANVIISANGTEYLRVSNTGNVGIGTTNPSSRLELSGATFNRLTITATADVQSGIQIRRTGGTVATDWELYTPSNSTDIRLYNGSDILSVSNTGNVGIGTTAVIANGTISVRRSTPKIVLSSSSYTTSQYLTSLGVRSGAEAFLIFGNNGQNEIRAGHSATGGYLDFYANNTLGQESASDGNFVARMHANGIVSIGISGPLGDTQPKLSVYSENARALALKANTSDYTIISFSPQNKQYGFYHSTANTFILREVGVTDVIQVNENGRVNFPAQPAFSTSGTNYTQSGSTGVASVIIPNSMLFNVGNHYNASTGVFTAPVAGKYYFAFWGLAYPLPENDRISIRYRKNGTAVNAVEHNGNSGSHTETSGCIFLELAANDTVDLTFTRDVGTTAYAYTTQWTMMGYMLS